MTLSLSPFLRLLLSPVRLLVPCLIGQVSAQALALTPTGVFEKASPSVVIVEVYRDSRAVAQGSGVAMETGVVVTNCHVLELGNKYFVRRGQRRQVATLEMADAPRDLCQLQAPGLRIQPASLRPFATLKRGERVYAIGAPKGLELTISEGIVSGLRFDEGARIIQTTAPISSGSSGGGLFDDAGLLVGITTFTVKESQNINFAIPAEFARDLPIRGTPTLPPPADARHARKPRTSVQQSIEQRIAETEAEIRKGGHPVMLSISWARLGALYTEAGELEQAILAHEKSVEFYPTALGWYWLSRSYHLQAINQTPVSLPLLDYATSAAAKQEELEDDQYGKARARLMQGIYTLRKGDLARAEQIFRELLYDNDPTRRELRILLALTLSLNGKRQLADQAFREAAMSRKRATAVIKEIGEIDPWLGKELKDRFPSG